MLRYGRLLLAALLLVSGLVVATAFPSVAADAGSGVTLQIATLTPLSPGPQDTLRITGKVVNRGSSAVTRANVQLHIGRSISSRSELHALRAAPVRSGLVKTADVGDLPPGSTRPFTLSIPIDQLSLIVPGVYPMQIVAAGDVDGTTPDLAAVNTFLPYVPNAGATATAATRRPTPIAWMVPLTATPSLLADGTLVSDGRSPTGSAVLDAVAPTGRLRHLLDAITTPGVQATATIDPAVIRSLALAANGSYQITQVSTGARAAQKASVAAKAWLGDLRSASGLDLVGLPYADADIAALLHDGQEPVADDARTRGQEVLRSGIGSAATVELTSGIAVPPGGHVDAQTAAYCGTTVGTGETASPRSETLVLAADSVPATGDNPSAAATVPGVSQRLLLSDDVLNQLVTQGPGTGARIAEQEFIAELAEAHLEDTFTATPAATGAGHTPQPLLISLPSSWNPSIGWLRALLTDTARLPWLDQVPVAGLATSTAEPRAGLQYPASARAAELPSYVVDSSAQILTGTDGLFRTPRKGDPAEPQSPESLVRPIQDSALSAVSSAFRAASGSQTFLDSAQAVIAGLQSQVRVVASPQVTLTSKSGKVPVTIENNLPAAVDVALELTSLDASRVSSGTTITRTVRAGQKVQVEVEVRAASAGTFPVRLTLRTPSGQSLGAPVQVLVRSTTYGIVATVFTIVALSLLGLAVLYRAGRALVRRRRTPRDPSKAGSPRSAGGV